MLCSPAAAWPLRCRAPATAGLSQTKAGSGRWSSPLHGEPTSRNLDVGPGRPGVPFLPQRQETFIMPGDNAPVIPLADTPGGCGVVAILP
jgi:hypothetical protein